MTTVKTVKRGELYQRIWQDPMARLANTFGLSDVGLAKICRKYDIPRPPRGYCAKKPHGYKPTQIALPNPERDDEIEITNSTNITASESDLVDATARDIAVAEQTGKPVEVAESLRGAHELVSRANQELQGARTDEHGIIVRPDKAVLDVSTSKNSLRRAFLIMDALLKALEERGYGVHAGPTVTIMGAVVRFSISEQLETKREPADDDDHIHSASTASKTSAYHRDGWPSRSMTRTAVTEAVAIGIPGATRTRRRSKLTSIDLSLASSTLRSD